MPAIAIAVLVGERTRLGRASDHDIRRIPVRDPTPPYPHSLVRRGDDPHPSSPRSAGTQAPRSDDRDAGTWAPAWVAR